MYQKIRLELLIVSNRPGCRTTLSYSISGGADAGKFQINGNTGALSFKAAPDFENPTDSGSNNGYVVKVRAR